MRVNTPWERIGPGGSRGLQNRPAATQRLARWVRLPLAPARTYTKKDGANFRPIFFFQVVSLAAIISPQRWTLSLGEQNAQHIRRGFRCQVSQLLHRQAAERVGNHDVWIVRNSAQVRHCVSARDEGLGADNRCGNAAPLEGKSVVHTAR